MFNKARLLLLILLLAVATGTGSAQAPDRPEAAEPLRFYKLEFVLKQVQGGRILNARSFSMTTAAGVRETASIRANPKVQLLVGGQGNLLSGSPQYIDVGVNIDCRSIREFHRGLSLVVTADIRAVPSAGATPGIAGAPLAPIARKDEWSSSVILPLHKPTLIFSSDDLASSRQMQLELTATPVT